MALSQDQRFGNQPRWMQSGVLSLEERVRHLEGELAAARALLNSGPEDATVVVDPYSENRQPLNGNPTIEFRWKAEGEKFWTYFLVRLEEDRRLEVHASSSLAVHPSSQNSVKVKVLER